MLNGRNSQTDNSIIEKYCYNNDTSNCDTYGGLYQWNEAMQYNSSGNIVQGICPDGWRLPSESDFSNLKSYVGSGNALKSIGQGTGTNTSGFSALLSGYMASGNSYWLGYNTNFWSSNEFHMQKSNAFTLSLISNSISIYIDYKAKGNAFSVRCIKN